MVRQLLLLAFIGVCHAQVCSSDLDCDPPLVCSGPPLKLTACVEPSEKKLFFSSEPDRINCLDGSACPSDHKCFRVLGSPIGVCVPKETPPESEPARHCVQSSACKDSERCYRPAGTPIGVCVSNDSRRKFLLSSPCQFDGDCAQDEFCGKPLGPSRTGQCFKKPTRRFVDDCYFTDSCFPGQYCHKGKCHDEVTGQPVKRRLTFRTYCLTDLDCPTELSCDKNGDCVKFPF